MKKPRHLTAERLEARQLLAVTKVLYGPDTISGSAGLLSAWTDNVGTAVEVVQSNSNILLRDISTGRSWSYPKSQIGRVAVYGGSGPDQFTSKLTDRSVVFKGAGGKDTLNGGEAADILSGGDGDDIIYGRGGADQISGGAGNDRLSGGNGNDVISGGDGNDTIRGGNDNDVLRGNIGMDVLYGDAGHDRVYGDAGNDSLYGGAGNDQLYGGDGDDTLVSIDAAATDKVYGNNGTDSFWIDREGTTSTDSVLDAIAYERAYNLHAIRQFANGADKTLDGDNIADPTDGLNYKRFTSRPLFAASGPSQLDIRQGALGDCWLMAALGSAAKSNANSVRQTVVDLGDGTYAVALGSNFYRVDADLPTRSAQSKDLTYAKFGLSGSMWVPIVEKAYAHFRTGANTYESLNGGWASTVFQAIGGSGFLSKSFTNAAAALNHIVSELANGKAVMANILNPALGAPLVGNHAYMVAGVNFRSGTNIPVSVVLRNPWGVDGAGNDGKNDGFVTVTGAQLVASMYRWDCGIQSARLV